MDGRPRRRAVGVLVLLLHHHCGRPHLEVRHPRLHPADDSGRRARLPRQVLVGRHRHGVLPRSANPLEPHPDELLLRLRHALHGDSLRRGCLAEGGDAALRQGDVHAAGGSCHRCLREPVEPLPHLAVQQGVHARQERTGESGAVRRSYWSATTSLPGATASARRGPSWCRT